MMDNGKVENGHSNGVLPVGEGVSGESFVETALRHRWIIAGALILSIAAGFIYILKTTPTYTSTSRICVEQTGPRIMGDFEGVMSGSKNYLYRQAELIKSTPIVGNSAETDTFRGFKTFKGIDNLTMYVKKNLLVDIGKKDDIISVSFNSPYPDEAAQIVNAVVDSYIECYSTRKQSIISQVLDILQNEKVKRDKQLTEKLDKILKFTWENEGVSIESNGENIVYKKLEKLSDALTEAQLNALNAKADYEAVNSMADEPAKIKQYAAASITAGVILVKDSESELLTDLRETEVELKSAMLHVTEDHPSLKAIKNKIEHIKNELDKENRDFAEAYIEVLRLRWITAKEREKELLDSFNEQCQAAQNLGVKATEFSILQSELKRAERDCEILDNRIKDLNVNEDTGALDIWIVEAAKPAMYPSKPEKTKIMMTMLVLGLMTGCGLAVARDWLDYRLRSADEIAAVLGIPVLGVIPTMIKNGRHKAWLEFKPVLEEYWGRIRNIIIPTVSGKEKAGSPVLPARKEQIISRGQKVHLQPRSAIAEAYRTVRTAIFFGVPKGQAKTILVTSPAPGDGKSTLASNLAITMAQAGQNTLVLDADFRKPMQHNIFDIENKHGLSNVLSGQMSLEQVLIKTKIDKLDLLVCGPEVPNPSEILNSELFADVLKKLVEKYDRVVIDSPPVAPVADSQILSATCDVTILVLRAEKSTRRHSLQARDALVGIGGKLLGAVVNDQPRKHDGYGYYSRYGKYGSYGYGEDTED